MSYASYTFGQLLSALEAHTPVDTIAGDDAAALVTERGARLLGLFPSLELPNVLWVHEEAASKYRSGNWMVGGERLWIAPERTFYYENPRDFEGFHVPSDIDPGNYHACAGEDLTYENRFSLLDLSTNMVYDGALARRVFSAVPDPYGTGLPYAGVCIDDSIRVPACSLDFCAWTVSMVYTCGTRSPGTALFPVRAEARLLSYFAQVPSSRCRVESGYARFRIDGGATYKIAVAPEDVVFGNPCKAVYLSPFPTDSRWFCVVKRGDDIPRSQQECVDVPQAHPEGLRGAVQSYNNGPRSDSSVDASPFGEIELQLVKGTDSDGDTIVSAGTHELLSYAGSREEMLGVAQAALNLPEPPALY